MPVLHFFSKTGKKMCEMLSERQKQFYVQKRRLGIFALRSKNGKMRKTRLKLMALSPWISQ